MEKIQVMVDKTAALKLLEKLPLSMQYGLLAGLTAGMAMSGAQRTAGKQPQDTASTGSAHTERTDGEGRGA